MHASVESTRTASPDELLRRELYDAAMAWSPHRQHHPVALFAVGAQQIHARLTQLESRTRVSVWNLQPDFRFHPETNELELDAHSRRRGIEIRMMVDVGGERRHPLLQSIERGRARVTTCTSRMLIVDARAVFCEGPQLGGENTMWRVVDQRLAGRHLRLWRDAWETARPAIPPRPAARLLGDRELHVARRMCLGLHDPAIARDLTVSIRTVQRDVASVQAHLGAGSRAEAVALMLGMSPS